VVAPTASCGWIGGGCAQPAVLRTVRQALADGRAASSASRRPTTARCASWATCWSSAWPAIRAARWSCSSTRCCRAPGWWSSATRRWPRAAAGLAPRVGLPVTVVAHGAMRPALPRRRACSAATTPRPTRPALPPGSFVVVATQGRRDLQGLRAALALQARQVFFVASERKARC
jgi:xanthine dehydrogenase accessory factor